MSSAATPGTLTAFVTTRPSRAAATCSATITPARSWASSVEAARCGVTTTVSRSSSGPVYGSSEKTSSAAPATFPLFRASMSAGSSTSSPRETLTMRTPSRIAAISSAPISPWVSGVSVAWSETNSAAARRSSSVAARSAPSSRKRSVATNGS